MSKEETEIYSPSHPEIDKDLKIAAIDLDDSLAVSIPAWISFVNERFGDWYGVCGEKELKSLLFTDLQQMKKTVPFYYYRLLKEEYRNSEVKANLAATKGAEKFLSELKNLDYRIIIMSARGESSLKLTVEWLNKNNLHYDELVLDKNKHIQILHKYPNLEFMVEDNRAIANSVARWGYRVYLLDNIYNQGNLHERVIRIYPKNGDYFVPILKLILKGGNNETKLDRFRRDSRQRI